MSKLARFRRLLRDHRGSSTVEFIFNAGLLIFLFMTLVMGLIYVTQYYNASYICRRVVRAIETSGVYDEGEIRDLADGLGGAGLEDLTFSVDASFLPGNRIQLRDTFRVELEANYQIRVLQLGDTPVDLSLPIRIRLSGMSEVYWK